MIKWWTLMNIQFFDDDQWRPKLCFSAHAPPFDYGWKHRFQGCESRSHRREIQSRSQQRSWLTWVAMTSHSQAMVNKVNWDLNVKWLREWVYTLLQEIVLSQYEVELERISELVSVSYNILEISQSLRHVKSEAWSPVKSQDGSVSKPNETTMENI
jgi:hypothetical protein